MNISLLCKWIIIYNIIYFESKYSKFNIFVSYRSIFYLELFRDKHTKNISLILNYKIAYKLLNLCNKTFFLTNKINTK